MKRKLTPPVESAHGCVGYRIIFDINRKEILIDKETDGCKDTSYADYVTSGFFRLVTKKKR